ncbi:hypothetical protein M885DRAFT_553339 [Pelagophyceae sp. CCMP2097]|nr:hypothetical protein M885DRAFT_553339 [Pelagophyceae sp. CCMP2097]
MGPVHARPRRLERRLRLAPAVGVSDLDSRRARRLRLYRRAEQLWHRVRANRLQHPARLRVPRVHGVAQRGRGRAHPHALRGAAVARRRCAIPDAAHEPLQGQARAHVAPRPRRARLRQRRRRAHGTGRRRPAIHRRHAGGEAHALRRRAARPRDGPAAPLRGARRHHRRRRSARRRAHGREHHRRVLAHRRAFDDVAGIRAAAVGDPQPAVGDRRCSRDPRATCDIHCSDRILHVATLPWQRG